MRSIITSVIRRIITALITIMVAASWGNASDRALIVGIEKYRDPRVPNTPGCAADARAMEQFVKTKYKFTEVKVLINEEATGENIQHWFRNWLIEGTKPGDRAFFFYAGHGSQLPDDNADESNEDGKDETLAPYDVDPRDGSNMIRDDLFDELIGRLNGRRAVLVFDSCHSGTISRGVPKLKEFARGGGARYLPSPEQFLELEAAKTRGAGGAAYIVKGETRDGRDLVLEDEFIEPNRFSSMSGAVIISAAGDRQQAFPIMVNGAYRGALSFSFIESLAGDQPALDDLERSVRTRILRLQTEGRLEGRQRPVFTVTNKALLTDKPLFATWEEAPIIAVVNRLSSITVQLRAREGKSAYRIGEKISYEVTSNASGYLYLVVFSQKNLATCIFPNSEDLNNQIAPGAIKIPRSGAYEFPIQEPTGRDVVVALVSKQRLNLGDKSDYTWNEVFERLNLKLLQDEVGKTALRGVGVAKKKAEPGAGDWQGAFLVLETLAATGSLDPKTPDKQAAGSKFAKAQSKKRKGRGTKPQRFAGRRESAPTPTPGAPPDLAFAFAPDRSDCE